METLQLLRTAGVVAGGVGLLVLWVLHFRRRRFRRFEWLLGSLFARH